MDNLYRSPHKNWTNDRAAAVAAASIFHAATKARREHISLFADQIDNCGSSA
jgi:hypothetical protein